jgi:hypothetical protein
MSTDNDYLQVDGLVDCSILEPACEGGKEIACVATPCDGRNVVTVLNTRRHRKPKTFGPQIVNCPCPHCGRWIVQYVDGIVLAHATDHTGAEALVEHLNR